MKKFRLVLLILVCSILHFSCQKESATVKVTGVTLNTTSISLEIGATSQLAATVSPSNASNKAVLWSTSSSSVATVDDNGLVIGASAGTAVITAKSDDGGMTATCAVTVAEKQSVVLDKTELTLTCGESVKLKATIKPESITTKLVWASSDEKVATVSDGNVTAVGAGSATISVSYGTASASCDVTVNVEKQLIKTIEMQTLLSSGKISDKTMFNISYDDQDRLRCLEVVPDPDHHRKGTVHKALVEYLSNGKVNLIDVFSEVIEGDVGLLRRVLDLSMNEAGAIDNAVYLLDSSLGVSYRYYNKRMSYREETYINSHGKNETTTAFCAYEGGNLDYMKFVFPYENSDRTVKFIFDYGNLPVVEDVNSVLTSLLLNNITTEYFIAGDFAMNMINRFPGNAHLFKSVSAGDEKYTVSYEMNSEGHVRSMFLEDNEGDMNFIFSYVPQGSQTYKYKEPFTYSGMGGTTWVMHNGEGDDCYLVFLDAQKFYFVEDDGWGFQEMIPGTYVMKGSSITMSLGTDDEPSVTTGTISGSSLTTIGGYIGDFIYAKTSNFMF